MINIEHRIEYGLQRTNTMILGFVMVCPKIRDAHEIAIFIGSDQNLEYPIFGEKTKPFWAWARMMNSTIDVEYCK